jgi:glycosyltransferase involved in cell wall biosynthesis
MNVATAEPRRVLFLAWAPFFSGAERALLMTLQSLDQQRYVPHVIAGNDGEFVTQVRALGIPCSVAHLHPLERRRPFAMARAFAAVLAAAGRLRPAVIHSNEIASFHAAGYVAGVLRIPAITHVRFPDTNAGYSWFLGSRFSRALFVSHDLRAAALQEAPGVFAGRSDVLHDGVELQPEWSGEERARVRRELGLETDATLVAMAGQVAEVKGIWHFVDAARLLASAGANAHFVVLGDDLKSGGRARRAMQEKVAALGLDKQFTFLGFRKDAPRLVQAFDIIAVPSLVEPLGNATLEAMAAGRPVVGSRVGGIPEMVVENETGQLVPPADARALADSIGRLVSDPECRARLSTAARARARDTFGIPAHGQRLQAHYDGLLISRSLVTQATREAI